MTAISPASSRALKALTLGVCAGLVLSACDTVSPSAPGPAEDPHHEQPIGVESSDPQLESFMAEVGLDYAQQLLEDENSDFAINHAAVLDGEPEVYVQTAGGLVQLAWKSDCGSTDVHVLNLTVAAESTEEGPVLHSVAEGLNCGCAACSAA